MQILHKLLGLPPFHHTFLGISTNCGHGLFVHLGLCAFLSLQGPGLMLQILRVVPYSATQLYSYEVLKKRFQNERGELSLSARLAAGGLAGMTATLVPLLSFWLTLF